jgi:hypothetical protein
MPKDDDLPHIDAVSGQAAWSLVQILAMHLVKDGVLKREDVEEGIDAWARLYASRRGATPAQKASSVLLQQFRDMLQTADRSSAN